MKLSEQIEAKHIQSDIARECVQVMENQVNSKKGMTGVLFKTLYAGIRALGADYAYRAILNLLPATSEALDPLWEKGLSENAPVAYLKTNSSLTAEKILSVTDAKIAKAHNKIVKATYQKVRNTLEGEIIEAVPPIADILGKYLQ